MLLISYLKFNDDDNRREVEPAEVMMAKKNWLGDDKDNDIMAKFQLKFELTNDPILHKTKSKDIEAWVVATKESSYRKFVMELKKYAIIHKLDKIENKLKKIDKIPVQCWVGIQLINENMVINENMGDEEEGDTDFEFDEV
jgi:hypothetical protein